MYLQKANIAVQNFRHFFDVYFQNNAFKTDNPTTSLAKYFLPYFLFFQPVQIGIG
jgi:hypothetical protein